MVDIWGINLTARNPPPSNHDPSYGPGALPLIDPFGGGTHHMPLNFSSDNNNQVKIPEREAKCDQHTAAILVIEAPDSIKHHDFV